MHKAGTVLPGGAAGRIAAAVVAGGLVLLAGSLLLQAGKQQRQYREQQQQQLRMAAQQGSALARSRIVNAEMLLRWLVDGAARDPREGWEPLRTQIPQAGGYFSSAAILAADSRRSFTLGAREFELSELASEALEQGRTVLLAPRNGGASARLYLLRELKGRPPRQRVLAELRDSGWLPPAVDTVHLAMFDSLGQAHASTRPQAPPIAAQGFERLDGVAARDREGVNLAWNESGRAWVGAAASIAPLIAMSDARLVIVAMAPDRPWSAAFWSALRTQSTFLPLILLAAWSCHRVARRHEHALLQLRRALGQLPERRVGVPVSTRLFKEVRLLAEAFNRAADGIRQQNETRRVLDEIDALLLPGGDYESVIDQVLGRVRAVTRAHNVGLTLVDPVTSHGRLFAVSATGGAPVTRVQLDGDMLGTLRGAEMGLTVMRSEPGRHSFLEPLQAGGSTFFWVWPVMAGGELAAILSVGYLGAPASASAIAGTGTQCAQRLGLSLASNARAERLYRQAHFDALTQLPNRLLFRDQLQRELHNAARTGASGALLFIDLDHFKRVNDSMGHEAGDQVLAIVAQRLRGCVKDGDTVARLSGDEFTVILRNVGDAAEAAAVAQRIIDSMRKPVRVGGRDNAVRASIGIAMFPAGETEPDELLHNADLAMYRAKESGRGGAEFYDPRLAQRVPDSGMFRALNRREFSLYYQPQYKVADGSLAGIEALLRWQQPGGVLRTSAEFVPAAEESGLIVDLGNWVLEAACAQLAQWREAGIEAPVLAVNLSVQQLREGEFVPHLRQQLERHGLPPAALTLEVSEAALIDEGCQQCIRELVELGVGLTLDDFGTGNAALAGLRRYPVQAVKIDRTLVEQLDLDRAAAALAGSVIAMAHALGRTVIAEGVESAEQLDYLREQRCHLAQGYFLARPLSAPDMTALLQGRSFTQGKDRTAASG